jgi:hypothetical protein
MPQQRFGGLEIALQDRGVATMPWRFWLQLDRWNEASLCRCLFDARIYDPEKVRAMLTRYQQLMETVCENPDRTLSSTAEWIQKNGA